MKISYNWLKNYFEHDLPAPEVLVEALTFHVFEVESAEKVGDDTVFDIKVLPDRAHYALCHRGIAYEISAILNQSLKSGQDDLAVVTSDELVVVDVTSKICRRYMTRFIRGVTVGESPQWLKDKLEVVGQRSINCVVDITNYVMLDCGQPLHAFDADKVVGILSVRQAKEGEVLELLPQAEVERSIVLNKDDVVIADEQGPLALAGIKGGLRAAVTSTTKNLILESANFEPVAIRRTATKYNIRNDSSKRFENDITPLFAPEGIEATTNLLVELASAQNVGRITDVYLYPDKPHTIAVSPDFISAYVGATFSESDITSILRRLQIVTDKGADGLIAHIPLYRQDLQIPQDIAEEVGRLYGYKNIPAMELPDVPGIPASNKMFYYEQVIRDVLVSEQFSEVLTYSLVSKGEVTILNPLASDKNFLRHSLIEGITRSLELNMRNAPLLGLEEIAIFEIGSVFSEEKETVELALGYDVTKNSKNKEKLIQEKLLSIKALLENKFGGSISGAPKDGVLVVDLTKYIETLPEQTQPYNVISTTQKVVYKKISAYPFSMRDVAVFVPESVTEEEVKNIIVEKSGALLARSDLFDVFKKTFPDGSIKVSYAFHIVFQSMEKTLDENDITTIMTAITETFTTKGWQVR